MPRKKSYITATDQFCGAGGSSQGAKAAGVEVKLAMNHWRLAVETHNTNFPETDHDCADISASDPRRYASTDILITSPECTNHSLAKGVKKQKAQMDLFDKGIIDPAAERSRATMWDVPRFAEYHDYNIIIVENVVDAKKWIMFDAWIHAMHSLGYNHKCCYLNSMHFWPTPQSRDRMYVVFWKKGNGAPDLNYRPLAYCSTCGNDVNAIQSWKQGRRAGKYGMRQQYVYCCSKCGRVIEPYYFAAFNCIDWSDIGTKIGERKRPLSPKTISRIKYGLKKYGNQNMSVANYSPGYCKPVTAPLSTVKTVDSNGLLTPFLIKQEHSQQMNVRHSIAPMATQTTRQSMMMVVPWIIEMNSTGEAKPSINPTATITAGGINHTLLVENKGQSKSHPVTDATGCLTTKEHLGLVTSEAWNSFISYYYGVSQASHITDPLGTASTKDRFQLISYEQPRIEDCYYRMLKPHEIKLAMAFNRDYVILGSGKDQVKQCGNAVTPPVMKWLINQCVKSLN